MPSPKSPAELHEILKSLLHEALRLHAEGATQPRLGRADGYVDGFMRALLEAGVSDHATLLAVVRGVRQELGGAATRTLEPDSTTLAA